MSERRVPPLIPISTGVFLFLVGVVYALESRRGIEAPGMVILGVSLAAAIGIGMWRSTRFGVAVWFMAAWFMSVTSDLGAPRLDRMAILALGASWLVAVYGDRQGIRGIKTFSWPEGLLALLVVTQYLSAWAPHEFPAMPALPPSAFILGGPVAALAAYFIGSQIMDDERSLRIALWCLVGVGIYYTAVTMLQRWGGNALVFPTQITDASLGTNPLRARGPLLNSAADGVLMCMAFAASLFLGQQRAVRGRRIALAAAVVMPLGIFATQTRAIYLGALAVVLGGCMFARGARRWYAIILVAAIAVVAVNFQTFTSSDRTKGGVASESEIESRLNDWATGAWAFSQKPAFGWGVGRYQQVNTHHHQSWPGVRWKWGYGYISHNTFLAYLAETGIIGGGLWMAALAAIAARTRRTWSRLPRGDGLLDKNMVLAFWLACAAWLISAMVVDTRLFPALTIALFLWAGMIGGLARGTGPPSRSPTGTA